MFILLFSITVFLFVLGVTGHLYIVYNMFKNFYNDSDNSNFEDKVTTICPLI